MGNNANAIPTRRSPEFRGRQENQDYGTDSTPRSDDTSRTKANPYAKQSGKETDGRTERTFGPISSVNEGRQTENLRTHYTVRERHASWSPKPSVQKEPLVCQPTIEIQPLTDEMLMAELPRYKKPESTIITLPSKISNLPGLNKPYSRHRKSEERRIVKGVQNSLNELKEAIIVPPSVHKNDLPGLNKPFSDFANENKHTEVWPSLNSTAHFEQYLPKENRDPKLFAEVDENLSKDFKRLDTTEEIVEDYLVELKKDLIELNETEEEIHEINIDLIKEDLEPTLNNQTVLEIQEIQEIQEIKPSTQQDTQTTELKLIGGELARFANEKLANDKIIPPSEPRQLDIGRIRQELLDSNTDSSETILDTLEDTIQELEYENSLDKIPDFPKDETEANEVPSANTWEEQNGLTGFESRPFDLTKLPTKYDNLSNFKSKLKRRENDYSLVEHGYAKQDKLENKEPLQEKHSLYEHGYAHIQEKEEKNEYSPGKTRFEPIILENLRIENGPPPKPMKEKSSFENWPKFDDNSTKTDGDLRLEHDWARLENLGRANRKPNLPGLVKPFRSFKNQEN